MPKKEDSKKPSSKWQKTVTKSIRKKKEKEQARGKDKNKVKEEGGKPSKREKKKGNASRTTPRNPLRYSKEGREQLKQRKQMEGPSTEWRQKKVSKRKLEAEERKQKRREEPDRVARREKRKEHKTKAAEVMGEAKQMWEQLRVKALSGDERAPLLERIRQLLSGEMDEFLFKKNTGKIIQTCLKYGDAKLRDEVCDEMKGKIVQLAENRYGRHLVKKMLKNVRSKHDQIMSELRERIVKLFKHKEASEVIEYYYTLANPRQRAELLLEFESREFAILKSKENRDIAHIFQHYPDKKAGILDNLRDLTASLLDKGVPLIRHSLTHKLILDFLTFASVEQMTDILESMSLILPEFAHTKDGGLAAAKAFGYAPLKMRKVMIKGLKGYVSPIATGEFGYVLILKMLDMTDDTNLLHKSILKELLANLSTVVSTPWGCFLFLHILAPHNPSVFTAYQMKILEKERVPTDWGKQSKTDNNNENNNEEADQQHKPAATTSPLVPKKEMVVNSKKDDAVRRDELLNVISGPLIEYLSQSENMKQMVLFEEGIKLLTHVILSAKGDKTQLLETLAQLLVYHSDYYAAQEVAAANPESAPLLCNFFASRFLRRLLIQEKEHPEVREQFHFSELFSKNISNKGEWSLVPGGSMLIWTLLDSPSEAVAQQVGEELEPFLDQLEENRNKKGVVARLILDRLRPDVNKLAAKQAKADKKATKRAAREAAKLKKVERTLKKLEHQQRKQQQQQTSEKVKEGAEEEEEEEEEESSESEEEVESESEEEVPATTGVKPSAKQTAIQTKTKPNVERVKEKDSKESSDEEDDDNEEEEDEDDESEEEEETPPNKKSKTTQLPAIIQKPSTTKLSDNNNNNNNTNTKTTTNNNKSTKSPSSLTNPTKQHTPGKKAK